MFSGSVFHRSLLQDGISHLCAVSAALAGFHLRQRTTGRDLYGISIVSSHPEKVQMELVQNDRLLADHKGEKQQRANCKHILERAMTGSWPFICSAPFLIAVRNTCQYLSRDFQSS